MGMAGGMMFLLDMEKFRGLPTDVTVTGTSWPANAPQDQVLSLPVGQEQTETEIPTAQGETRRTEQLVLSLLFISMCFLLCESRAFLGNLPQAKMA